METVKQAVQPYPELTLEDIEEFRQTGKFSKPFGKYEQTITRALIMDGYSNQDILDGFNF